MKTLQLMFSFMLLGYSSTEEYKANITDCPDAKYKMGIDQGNHVKATCLEPQDHSLCLIPFHRYRESVTWNFVAPEGVKDIRNICTRGSLYTEQYGELVESSNVKSIYVENGYTGPQKRKKKKALRGVVKGQHVKMEAEYIIKSINKTFTYNIWTDFKIQVLPNCKEGVEAWFCINIPGCIYQANLVLCYKDIWNL